MPKDSIVFKAKSQKLTAFSRTRNTGGLFFDTAIFCNLHAVPIREPKEKHKARDENRQEGEQASIEIAFH